ncbi:MAG: hypothetical protein M0R46_10130 [Candidatus Muirbacterium halophilum]|nr:hypothetical protein [Candidatus Muirbacterium halophilum]MCK9476269.1 hypothetical protein [Candidatus Muirbacterium halophilum]
MRALYSIFIFITFLCITSISEINSEEITQNIYKTIINSIIESNKLSDVIYEYKKLPIKPEFKQVKIENNNYRITIEGFENPILINSTGKELLEWEYSILNPEKLNSKNNIPDFLFREKTIFAKQLQPVVLKAYADGNTLFAIGYNFDNLKKQYTEDLFIIDSLEILIDTVKEQQTSKTQIDYLNRKNKSDNFIFPDDTYEVSYKCYFYSVAHILDYYERKMKKPIKRNYREFLNGKKNKGIDPRIIELLYRYRNSKENKFPLTPTMFAKDPVTGESISMSLKDVMLVFDDFNKVPNTIKDQYTDKIFRKKDYLNFYEFKLVKDDFYCFEDVVSWLKQKKPLIGGIALEKFGKDFRVSSHSVMIIGFFTYLDFKFLIYKDSYGKNISPIKFLPFYKFREIYGYKFE